MRRSFLCCELYLYLPKLGQTINGVVNEMTSSKSVVFFGTQEVGLVHGPLLARRQLLYTRDGFMDYTRIYRGTFSIVLSSFVSINTDQNLKQCFNETDMALLRRDQHKNTIPVEVPRNCDDIGQSYHKYSTTTHRYVFSHSLK